VDTLVFKQPLPRFLDYLNLPVFSRRLSRGRLNAAGICCHRWNNSVPLVGGNLNEGADGWPRHVFKLCLADNLAVFFDGASSSNAYLI